LSELDAELGVDRVAPPGVNDAADYRCGRESLKFTVGQDCRLIINPDGLRRCHRARAALDKDDAVIGYVFESKGFSRIDIDTNALDADRTPTACDNNAASITASPASLRP
jgi:hypothetical protein